MSNLEMKLFLSVSDKVLSTVLKSTDTQPANLLKSLAVFQQDVNAALTKLIEDRGDTVEIMDEDDDGEVDDEDDAHCEVKKIKR